MAPESINIARVKTFPECMFYICNVKACIKIDVFRLTREVQVAKEAPSDKCVVRVVLLHVGELVMEWLSSAQ